MATKTNKTIEEIANCKQTQLSHILSKVALIEKLNQFVQPLLDSEIAKCCQVANYRDGQLILQIQNSAIATHLRFLLPDLLCQLRKHQELAGLCSIEFYIRPHIPTPESPELKVTRSLSDENAEILKSIAEGVSDDNIKEKLTALAEHAKRNI